VGGEIFRTSPDRPWSPPSLLYNWYRVFPEGKERPGRDADPSPPSTAVGHGRAELHLCSPYGPYGLYRVSVPVQSLSACTESQCLYRVSVPVQSLSACTESQCLYKGALYIRTRNILFIVHKSLSKCAVPSRCNHHHHHHHHISVMELGHLLTRSGLTCPEVFSKVCQIKLYILLLCKYQYVV